MDQMILQIGVGGALALLVIREVLTFLKERGPQPGDDMYQMVKDLHEWHAVADQDGVKVWYVRRSLEEAVEKLATTIEKLADTQRATQEVMREMARDLRDLRKE